MWISLQDGQLVIEDIQTGERLKTPLELEAVNQAMEQQAAEMAALLARYQAQFGELPGGSSEQPQGI